MVRTLAAIEDTQTWTAPQTFQRPLAVQGQAPTDTVLVVKGVASQSGNLLELHDSTDTPVMKLDVGGNLQLGTIQPIQTPGSGAYFAFNSNIAQVVQRSPGATVLLLQGASEQTALLQEWQVAGAPRAAIEADGKFRSVAANEQTTVGSAGAASAPPANPAKYLLVKDSAGTTLAIPMYPAS